jgi:hypothetical protein
MPRRLLASFVALACAATLLVLGASATPAAAKDGLDTRSDTTYTVDAAAGVVHVLVDMTFTNSVADQRDGNQVTRAYFTGFALPVPLGAARQTARIADGAALHLDAEAPADAADYFLLDIAFADQLYTGQSTHVLVGYDITGQPPRSVNPSRVNAAYTSFNAYGIGDDGAVTVRVIVPDGVTVDTFGATTERTEANGNAVYTATDIPDPSTFVLFVSARNDPALTSTNVQTAGGIPFVVRSWPGDTTWTDFVMTQIHDGVPMLSTLIGQPWPLAGAVDVHEAYTPYLYGYAGWFSASKQQIEIGENLDQEVVLHELSHAWFSDAWFTDRWLNEGLAQTFSNLAVTALGGSPKAPTAIADDDPGRIVLNTWGEPRLTAGADAVERYGYNASWSVVSAIATELGPETMRKVFTAVADHSSAYPAAGVTAQGPTGAADWRRFLDLVDELGGSTTADDLMARYVVTPEQSALLAPRATARTAYHDLVAAGGAWSAPAVVRSGMAAWSFGAATASMSTAATSLRDRDALATKAAELGVAVPTDYRTAYENATTDAALAAADASIRNDIDIVDALLRAGADERGRRGTFARIGLIGTDLPGLLAQGRAAFAAGDTATAEARARTVHDAVTKATDLGEQRTLLTGSAVLLLVLVAIAFIALRRRKPTAAEPALDDEPPSDDEIDAERERAEFFAFADQLVVTAGEPSATTPTE